MINKGKIGGFTFFALWFGAAVSLAEIMTGSLLAPLGLKNGLIAILLGHAAGCLILAFVGVIGFREKQPALRASRISLGRYGSYLVSVFNIVQLVGWTAIMLIQCARSLEAVTAKLFGINNFTLLVIIIGILVAVWALNVNKGINWINNAAVILLAVLSVVMMALVLKGGGPKPVTGSMSFGLALELSIIMPLSWLPLISDYTMKGKSAKGSFAGSFLGYFIGSSVMYAIGLIIAVYTGNSDPVAVMIGLGMGYSVLLIVVLSTVTTTFLDVYSSVMSTLNLVPRMSKNTLIIFFAAVGTLLALYFPMEEYQNFLHLIGSVFAPVFSVIITDYFFYKKDRSKDFVNIPGVIAAALGIMSYYAVGKYDLVIGTSIPAMIITTVIYIGLRSVSKKVGGDDTYVK